MGGYKDLGPNARKERKAFDPNFGLPSPGEVVKKVASESTLGKTVKKVVGAMPTRGNRGMGSSASAAPAAQKKAKSAASNIGKAADRAFKSQERDEKYRKSREQLGNFYLQSAGGYGSDWFSKKKK